MTFTQLNARLKNFLNGWLLVLGLKECLLECATMCVKSEVPKSQASLNNSLKICHTSSIEIWTTFSTAGRPSAFAIIRGSQASR